MRVARRSGAGGRVRACVVEVCMHLRYLSPVVCRPCKKIERYEKKRSTTLNMDSFDIYAIVSVFASGEEGCTLLCLNL